MHKIKYTLLIFFIILCIVGIAVTPKLIFQINPTADSKTIAISYRWAMATPITMEQQVTANIEGACATLQNIKKITSRSSYGYGNVTLQLEKNTDPTYKRFEVATLIRQIYASLPKGVSYPQVSMRLPKELESSQTLMNWQLCGPADGYILQQKAEFILKPSLSQIPEVAEVNIQGNGDKQWTLSYKNHQLQALNIDEEDIVAALNQHYQIQNLGKSTTSDGSEINVSLQNKDDIKIDSSIVIGTQNQRIIRLHDLVKIEQKNIAPQNYYRINGKNSINISISAEKKANQISLASAINQKIALLEKQLPKDYQLVLDYDASVHIKENLEKIADQIILALIILIAFVWLTSWSWRYMTVVTTGLLVNILLCNIVFWALKIELHLYSLAALTTSLGIVIDNTIVMIDYYKRHHNLRIFSSLLSATLTTLAGLTVVFFLPETNKIILEDFAIVFTISLLMSLFVSMYFIPVFEQFVSANASQKPVFKRKKKRIIFINKIHKRCIMFFLRFKKTFIAIAVLSFGLPFGLIPEKINGNSAIEKTFNIWRSKESTQELLDMADKVFGGTLSLFINDVYQKSYYSDPQRTALHINVSLPNQCTIAQMNAIFLRLENVLKPLPQIDKFISTIYDANDGNMTIFFKKDFEKNTFPFTLKNKIIDLSTEMSGINWNIYGVGEGFSIKAEEDDTPSYEIKLQGYNYNTLDALVQNLQIKLEKYQRVQRLETNGNGRDKRNRKTFAFILKTNPKALLQNNIDNNQLFESLQKQNQISETDLYINLNGKYEAINVLPENHEKFDTWKLNNLSAISLNKKNKQARVKMQDIAELSKENIASDIFKENQQYQRHVTFEYIGSSTHGDKIVEEIIASEKVHYPIGYSIEKQKNEQWDKKDKQQYWLIALIILVIFIICAITFENLKQAFALVMLIPISFIGVFVTFVQFEFNFDQGGYAAFILLSGNVVCAGIFIISEYNLLKIIQPNIKPINGYLKAFNHKIYPILLTVLSTIVGLIPFLIYGQKEAFWFSLGVGTIGGLLFSLLAIWLYLPIFLLKKEKSLKQKLLNN
ncbi:MAG: efflux RND transporter permease subunit [Pseudarcicella sp.]|nr:efflux RND transporter permease subunit [Pseudarcicella sp.]MBP6411103.1 efflux RND transporter permease subunit [Pseudarcicella sp.]